MRILAYVLAFVTGGFVCLIPFSFIVNLTPPVLLLLVFPVMLYCFFMVVRYFYKKIVVKFGYKLDENIAEDDKKVKIH